MDFFTAQDRARKRTRQLVLLYVGGVAATAFLTAFVVAFFVAANATPKQGVVEFPAEVFLLVAGGLLLVILGASAARLADYAVPGAEVAALLGGQPVPDSPRDPAEQRFRNVAEEMAIASGFPVPSLHVLSAEAGINAFAAGRSPADAAIAVTRGALEAFSRDELQAVIAHEYSHLVEGDTRLNGRLAAGIAGLAFLALVGGAVVRGAARMGRGMRRSKGGGGVVAGLFALGALLWVSGSLGALFARLLQAAVSRQREFLADAAAVQYTRNPPGMFAALSRLKATAGASRIEHARAAETAHFYFASALAPGSLLASHPPLEARLKAIDPAGSLAAGYRPLPPSPPPSTSTARRPAASAPSRPGFPPPLPGLGAMPAEALAIAAADLRGIPQGLRAAAGDPVRLAASLLLLASADSGRDDPFAALASRPGFDALRPALAEMAPGIAPLALGTRLAALEVLATGCRRWTSAARDQLRQDVETIVVGDNRLTTFELAFLLLLERRLDLEPPPLSPSPLDVPALHRLLGVVSALGGGATAARVDQALRAAGLPAGAAGFDLVEARATLVGDVAALRLSDAQTRAKVLAAAIDLVHDDGVRSEDETLLLNALGAALDLPRRW